MSYIIKGWVLFVIIHKLFIYKSLLFQVLALYYSLEACPRVNFSPSITAGARFISFW